MKELVIVVTILIGVVLGCGAPQNSNSGGTSGPNSTTAPKVEISSITWDDYDRIYNPKSSSTDMQKEQLWKGFKDKVVAWNGTVEEVSEGALGGLTLSIKMNKDTMTSDVIVNLKRDQKERASRLSKGMKVSYTGKLNNYGGAILPASLDDGEIK